jgi:hypothetical protein
MRARESVCAATGKAPSRQACAAIVEKPSSESTGCRGTCGNHTSVCIPSTSYPKSEACGTLLAVVCGATDATTAFSHGPSERLQDSDTPTFRRKELSKIRAWNRKAYKK